jgi:hypothetical protein
MLLVITVALVTRAVLWLVAMVLGTLLAVAALTTVTAGIGARRAAAETLQPKLPDHDAAQRRGSTNSAA